MYVLLANYHLYNKFLRHNWWRANRRKQKKIIRTEINYNRIVECLIAGQRIHLAKWTKYFMFRCKKYIWVQIDSIKCNLSVVFVSMDLNWLDLPDFCVAILTSRNERFVVQPNQARDLWLRMRILNDGVFRWVGHWPDDYCGIQRTTGNHLRIRRPGDAIDARIVESPFLLVSRLRNRQLRNISVVVVIKVTNGLISGIQSG